jgi:hypothetical protein
MTAPDQKPSVRRGVRFSPHVLPFLATIGLAWIPFSSAIVSGVFWWWGPTYRQVAFVMEEAHANDGSPYIDGHVDGDTEITRVSGMMVGDQIAPEGAPAETFAPSRRILLWQSPSAPDFGVEGRSINDISVAALPTLPGLGSLLDSLAMTALIVVAGLWVTVWVYKRSRKWGQLDIRGSGRSTRAS